MAVKMEYVLGAVGLVTAAGLAVLATKSAGPVQLTKYVELREGPLQQHLVSTDGLLVAPVTVPHHYPDRVARGVSQCITHGFAPLYRIPDPVAAALPSEQAW